MFARWKRYIPVIILILFSLFLFRNYFLKGLVPFPANLLVSYYEPWKSYPVPEYPNGPPNKAMGFDNVRIYYPLKKVAADLAGKLRPPLWNPYNFTGNVLLATYQSAIFHPLSWLFLIAPQIDAWSIIVLFQPVLAAMAMYVFLSVLGVSRSSRFLGSLAYACSGFFITWWQESYMFTYSSLFLPIALSAIELFLKKPKGAWLALLAASLALSIVSGAFQMTFYVYIFTAIWILYRTWNNEAVWHYLFLFGMAIGVSLLMSAVHLVPSIEAYIYSTRISADIKYIFDDYLLPLSQLVTLIAPDYYGNPATYNHFGHGFYHERLIWLGAVPLILILTQLSKRAATGHQRFFRFAFVGTLSLVLSIPTTWFLLYYLKLPLISTMTPSRIMMLVTFTGAVLAAYGTEEYWKGFSKKTLLLTTGVIALSILAAGAAAYVAHYTDITNFTYKVSLRNLIIPILSLGAILAVCWITRTQARLRTIGYVVLIGILMGNILLFTQKYLYFSERRFVYPEVPVFTALKKIAGYTRFWTYDNGDIEKNFATFYGLFSPEGYDSIIIRRYAEFLAFANSGGASMQPDRANALIHYADHLNEILTNQYRKRTLELLGVRYILHKLVPDRNEHTVQADPKELPRVWEDGTYAIHEYKQALPRALLYSDAEIVPDGQELLTQLFDTETHIATTVFLEEKPDNIILQPERGGSVSIESYAPNMVTLRTDAIGDTILFLSDAYYPGWKAFIDETEVKIYRANYAFRGVAVPKGAHHIEFRFEPMSWKLGIAGSLTGIFLCSLFLIFSSKIESLDLDRKRHS